MDNPMSKKEFIMKYKAAFKANLTKQEFASYIGTKPDSVSRRRLKIKDGIGLELPYLVHDNDFDGRIDLDKLEKFEEEYQNLVEMDSGPKQLDLSHHKKNKIYVVTSAQNATPVNDLYFATLLRYCEIRNAELIVIPYRYKNPTSIWSDSSKGQDWWWEPLKPYLLFDNIKICKGLQILCKIKTQPTAVYPLSGMDSYTGSDSGIFGHPKIEGKSVATPSQKFSKWLTTTGSCTIPNYTDSKAGHKGEFHHNYCAVVVEVEGDEYFPRYLHGDENGNLYDCEHYYTPRGRREYGRAAAIVHGDIHAEFTSEGVEAASFSNPDSMANVLKPQTLVYHDVIDFFPRNHHHKDNDIFAYGKHHFGRDNVEEGLQMAADFIDRNSRPNTINLIVRSNHDEAFDRWLLTANPRHDPENATFYYYMKLHQMEHVKKTKTSFESFNAFEYWCKNPYEQRGLKNVHKTTFLKRDESYEIAGIETGFHGDIGINGSRGTLKGYAKIGPKTVIGHGHCLTKNHSVLVKNKGWVNINNVEIGDKVLSYNKNDENEYVDVTDTYNDLFTGNLVSIGGDKFRQEVTDYHNMYLKDHSYVSISDAILFHEAGEVPLTANSLKKEKDLDISDDTIRQVVALCADGHIQEGKYVRFHFKKERKIERLKELFDHITPFAVGKDGSYKTSLKFESIIYNDLEKWVDFDNKCLPSAFLNLSTRQKEIFISELKFWDGTFDTKSNGNQFSTAKKDEANLISTILTELGYRNTYKLRWKKEGYDGCYLITWNSNKDTVILSENSDGDKERFNRWNVHTKRVENEPVYCLTNKNNNFWVKHNVTGTVSLTGNSPGVIEGAYQVGVSTDLNLSYNQGPSSWLNTHCIIYPNGSRTLVNIINGKWRASYYGKEDELLDDEDNE